MCFQEFCSILCIKMKCSIISLHAPSSNNICAFYLHFFDTSENIITISPYLINLSHRFFFHASCNCFLGSFFNLLYSFCFFSGIFFHFFICFFFLLCLILYPTVPPPHIYITFPVFLYPHYYLQAFSTPYLKDPHGSLWLSDIISVSLHSKKCSSLNFIFDLQASTLFSVFVSCLHQLSLDYAATPYVITLTFFINLRSSFPIMQKSILLLLNPEP